MSKFTPDNKAASALVLGAGTAGATVALALRQAGMAVHLVEKEPIMGGHAIRMGCKADAACVRCNVCAAVSRIKAAWQDRSIKLYCRSKLAALASGKSAARFSAVIHQQPMYVSSDLCVECGACAAVCPTRAFAPGNPVVAAGTPVLDPAKCVRSNGKLCVLCQDACPVKAIDLAEPARDVSVDADVIVVATGFEPFTPSVNAAWGHAAVPNVITGWEAEQQMLENRLLLRPADGRQPGRLAFIQCIGSRSFEIHRSPFDSGFCSTVCCAYAMRMARRIRHMAPETAITFFYMDLQAVGRDADAFAAQARGDFSLIRARPYELRTAANDNVLVVYEDKSLRKNVSAEFDMVVLSIGMRPASDNEELATFLGVPLDEHGFFGFKGVSAQAETWKAGVYIAGAAEAPTDLAGAIASAEAITAMILAER